jgi:hypothetical protein
LRKKKADGAEKRVVVVKKTEKQVEYKAFLDSASKLRSEQLKNFDDI